jgi:thioredoxin 1
MAERRPESIRQMESRVWDMVLNLIHPAALYVLLQLLILNHFWSSAALGPYGPLHPVSLAIYGLQFLGAWAVFYTTLLRDMGHHCPWGTVLCLAALVAVALQFVLFPKPEDSAAIQIWIFLAPQLVLAGLSWPLTYIRWRRLKAREEKEAASRTPGPHPLAVFIFPAWQQFQPDVEGHEGATDWFYSLWIWVLAIVPLAAAVLIAALRRKRTPELPQVTEDSWEAEVIRSPVPVVVHAYRSWSIGDRVIENQVVKLQAAALGRLKILWLDIEKNPSILSLYPTLGEKSVGLFKGTKLLWQSEGVHDHLTILREIERYL